MSSAGPANFGKTIQYIDGQLSDRLILRIQIFNHFKLNLYVFE